VVESFLSFDSEVSIPPLKETLYIVLEATPKNDQWLVLFVNAKRQVLGSTFQFVSPFFI
jgi:hypothetical protein